MGPSVPIDIDAVDVLWCVTDRHLRAERDHRVGELRLANVGAADLETASDGDPGYRRHADAADPDEVNARAWLEHGRVV